MKAKEIIKTGLLGVLAGISISLGGFLFIIAKSFFGDFGPIGGALFFPIGLILVCFLGFNLFTGKIGFLFNQEKKGKYALSLLIMYIGNLIGSFLIGLILYFCFRNVSDVFDVVKSITIAKITYNSFTDVLKQFLDSCLCGIMVYLAVFLFKKCNNIILKIIGIIIPIFTFVLLGFNHCIANAFYFSFNFDFSNGLIFINLLISTLGNSVGAIVINLLTNK